MICTAGAIVMWSLVLEQRSHVTKGISCHQTIDQCLAAKTAANWVLDEKGIYPKQQAWCIRHPTTGGRYPEIVPSSVDTETFKSRL